MITLVNRRAKHRAAWDWYPHAMRLLTHLLTVQLTLLVTGKVLDNRAVMVAAACVGVSGMVLGMPIMDSYYKKRRTAKPAETGDDT